MGGGANPYLVSHLIIIKFIDYEVIISTIFHFLEWVSLRCPNGYSTDAAPKYCFHYFLIGAWNSNLLSRDTDETIKIILTQFFCFAVIRWCVFHSEP